MFMNLKLGSTHSGDLCGFICAHYYENIPYSTTASCFPSEVLMMWLLLYSPLPSNKKLDLPSMLSWIVDPEHNVFSILLLDPSVWLNRNDGRWIRTSLNVLRAPMGISLALHKQRYHDAAVRKQRGLRIAMEKLTYIVLSFTY